MAQIAESFEKQGNFKAGGVVTEAMKKIAYHIDNRLPYSVRQSYEKALSRYFSEGELRRMSDGELENQMGRLEDAMDAKREDSFLEDRGF